MLRAQLLMARKGDDACHAGMLSSFDLNTTQRLCDAAKFCTSSGGPAGANLTAIPAACHSATTCLFCLCGTAWGTTCPLLHVTR